jgi:putative ABC transport system ATP-binding protein
MAASPISPPPGTEPVIAITGLDHFLGVNELRIQVLYRVSLEIMPGETVILTGPSGSGKTTLLTLCGTLRSVQSGSVLILGQEMRDARKSTAERIREQVGVIFQAPNLLNALTARQNVALALGLDESLSRSQRNEQAAEMLHSVGLGARLDHYPEQLSDGQKQRVAVARAFVRSPKILLADEPTASLDRETGREVIELLHTLARDRNCAVLLVTHDPRILNLADRILTLDDGRLVSFSSTMAANIGSALQAFTHLQRSGQLVEHVDSLSTKQFMEMLENLTAEFRQYVQLFQVSNREAVQSLFDSVLEAITLKMIRIMGADRGTLYFVDWKAGLLRSRIATGPGGKKISLEAGIRNSIAGRVVLTNRALNIPDAYRSQYFNPEVDRATGYVTRNILCMPLMKPNGEIFAVAQLLNKKEAAAFTKEDEEQFSAFAEPFAVILENCMELRDRVVEDEPMGKS